MMQHIFLRHSLPRTRPGKVAAALLVAALLGGAGTSQAAQAARSMQEPLVIQEQGSFAAGGTVIRTPGTYNPRDVHNPAGQTLHGDHAYVFYQKPVNARKYPMAFLHGAGQFSKTFETTPDGREGFQNIFLRRGFSVYLMDQPRRGDAGRSTVEETIKPVTSDQMWFQQFRVGEWPNYFPGVQFSQDKETLNQYFRQMTPNTGAFDLGVVSDAVAAVFEKTGPGILVTHSQGGGCGWASVMKSPNIRAVVSYEPGSNCPFPEGEVPDPLPTIYSGPLKAYGVPMEEFKKLTQIPIVIFYGDFIPKDRSDNPSQDYWQAATRMVQKWADTVNKYGGDVTVVHLPDIGIRGNTHFPFSDLNNVDVADQLSKWLHDKKLDERP